jgi:GNAT superfamily N-acetyltransferase
MRRVDALWLVRDSPHCYETPVSKSPRFSARRVRISDKQLRASQVSALLALYRQASWARDRTRHEVVKMLRHTPFMITAWRGSQLVGFARVLTDFVYRAVLYDVIVDETARGDGIGMLMVSRLQSHPKLRRVESWYLKTPDAHEFYEKLGWTRDAESFMELRRARSTASSSSRTARSVTSRSEARRRTAPGRRR